MEIPETRKTAFRRSGLVLLLIAIGLAVGWFLAGLRPGEVTEAIAVAPSTVKSGRAVETVPGTSTSGHSLPWQISAVDVSELEGLHELSGRSPVPKLNYWLLPVDGQRGSADNGFVALGDWLDLSPSERERLGSILSEVTDLQLAWERQNLQVEDLGSAYRVHWQPATEVTAAFREKIDQAFDEALARSLWLKGDLEKFAALDPGLIPEERGVLQLSWGGAGSVITLVIRSEETQTVRTYRAPADLEAAARPGAGEAFRFYHLLPWKEDVAEIASRTPVETEVPVAEMSGTPGMVISPFNGKIIDVRGIPAGTLVADPSFPAEERAFFRVPPEATAE